MPIKKTPLNPPIVLIDHALNPQGMTVPAMLARLRCPTPGCNCHFPDGKVHCPCPNHRIDTPDFSIVEGPEGVVAECHTRYKFHAEVIQCKPEKLQAALAKMIASTVKIEIPKLGPIGTFFDWNAATKHAYSDPHCRWIYQVARLGEGVEREQEVRARRDDPDYKWIYNLDGVVPILYKLHLLAAAQLILVCDNERAADALNEELLQTRLWGKIIATTTMEGVTHLHRTDLSPLFGKDLIFFPTEDGGQHLYPRALIQALDGRALIRIVELPNRGTGGDYTHFQAAGHTVMDALELSKTTR